MNLDELAKIGAGIEQSREELIELFNAVTMRLQNEEQETAEERKRDEKEQIRLWELLDRNLEVHTAEGQVNILQRALDLYDAKAAFAVLDVADTSQYKYNFKDYAKRKTGLDSKTIDNLIRVAGIFIVNKDKLNVPKGVEFNAWRIKFSNLLVAAHRAATDTLTVKQWKLLANEETVQEDLLTSFSESDRLLEDNEDDESLAVFYEQDSVVYYWDRLTGKKVGIASLEHDSSEPSVEEGINLLLEVIKEFSAKKKKRAK